MRRRDFLLTGLIGAMPWRAAGAAQGPLLEQLRAGGLNIYFRHSLTERAGQPDDDLTSCATQRNLTEAGVALAREIGRRIRLLRVPVGTVLSSPYCRCVDTARWAFERVTVADWLETDGNPQGTAERRRLQRLAMALSGAPAHRANDIFVAHGNNLAGLALLHRWPALPIDEAEAVIVRPNGSAVPEIVARVRGLDWGAGNLR